VLLTPVSYGLSIEILSTILSKKAVQIKREKYDDFLERVEILKCMEKFERAKLADAFREEWFESGDFIIR